MASKATRTRKLELKPKDLRKNVVALYKLLQKNEDARTAFIRDPAGQIGRRIVKRKLPPQQISEANRLLFAIIANDEMVKWLQDYGARARGKLDKKAFALEFARQIQKLDDPSINAGVLGNAALGVGIPGLGEIAYQCVVNETPNKHSSVCTPVAKDSLPKPTDLDPEVIRLLTGHLIQHAKQLSQQGTLTNLGAQVR